MKCVSERGFTLLEVLVALAILALSAAALIKQTGSSLRQSALLEEKLLAAQVAEMRLGGELRLQRLPSLGVRAETVEFSGQEWPVELEVFSTAREDMRRLEVRVLDGNDQPLVSLVAFMGEK